MFDLQGIKVLSAESGRFPRLLQALAEIAQNLRALTNFLSSPGRFCCFRIRESVKFIYFASATMWKSRTIFKLAFCSEPNRFVMRWNSIPIRKIKTRINSWPDFSNDLLCHKSLFSLVARSFSQNISLPMALRISHVLRAEFADDFFIIEMDGETERSV